MLVQNLYSHPWWNAIIYGLHYWRLIWW